LNIQPQNTAAPTAPAKRSFAAMRQSGIPRPVRHLCVRDDGRQYRARHQLLGDVPEIPFAGACRIRDRLALAAISVAGGFILLGLGPSYGIFLNTIFYLPLLLWLVNAPYGPRFRTGVPPPRRAVRGLADITHTVRAIRDHSVIVSMTILAGAASFFVGNAYSSQMPGFAEDLGHGDPGLSYSMLLAADACGAFLAGVLLESGGLLPPRQRTAIVLAILWCVSLAGFSLSWNYPLALGLLFTAGFFELSFNTMATSLVQINAPLENRGRVIGLFGMASYGLRAFSGVSVGLLGSLIGVHWSLAASALAMLATAAALLALP
jgi:hypothetical protein